MNPFTMLIRARDKPGRRSLPRNSLNGSAYSFFSGALFVRQSSERAQRHARQYQYIPANCRRFWINA